MSSLFRSNRILATRLAGLTLCILVAAGLGGCGSGAVSGDSAISDSGPATLVVTLTETNSAVARTSIAFGNPAKVNATFKTARGNPIVGAVITFTTNAAFGVLDPASGTALTDASGVASVTLSSSTASGAGTVTASGQTTVAGATAPTTYTSSISYTAGTTGTPTFVVTLTDPNNNAARTSVSPQNPAKVNATFKTGSGAAVVGAVVTFTTTNTIGTFIPANGTAVTDANGVASVLLYPSSTSGGATVTATSQTVIAGSASPTTVTNSVAFSATAAPAIVVTLTDPTSGAPRTSISSGSPARVTATLRQTTGAPAVGAVVTFTTDATLGVFAPASGTALTDSNGIASVLLNPVSLTASGAGIVTASGQVGSGTGTAPVTATIGYAVGAANVTISAVAIQTPVLSAFGTTGVSVTVSAAGIPTATPLTVNFTSPCAASGRAALASPVTTVNGVASTTYRDIGCASADTITATVSGLALSATGTLTVTAPAVGSIQFVSSRPTSIALRGTGGAGRQETSLVSFRVVDVAGNPVGGRTVNFSLSTAVGGITLTPASATSDPATGLVVTNVQAGSISTPVRVIASTLAGTQTLTTQSDQLTISTGVPTQDGFSLSVSTFNIEGGIIDGNSTNITARLTDRFRNPVPDGTVVNFTAAGGSIVSTCSTTAGVCSSTLTSQNFRPANGRVNVLAFAIGEESFDDANGNGWYDLGEVWRDFGDPYVDVNDDGQYNLGEPFFKFDNSQAAYSRLGDGRFNGVSCNETVAGGSSPGSCSPVKGIFVRGTATVIFSGSTAPAITTDVPSIAFPPCSTTVAFTKTTKSAVFTIWDANGNVLPAGTTVAFASSNGTIVSAPASFTIPNTNLRSPAVVDGVGTFTVTLESNATQTINATAPPAFICTNERSAGQVTVTVTTPSGRVSTRSINVDD